MYTYKISAGTPEGFDFFFTLEHEMHIPQEQFEVIVEELMAECYEEHWAEHGFSMLDSDKLAEKLSKRGFIRQQQKWVASYDLEPYFEKNSIKSQRLLAAINKKDKLEP